MDSGSLLMLKEYINLFVVGLIHFLVFYLFNYSNSAGPTCVHLRCATIFYLYNTISWMSKAYPFQNEIEILDLELFLSIREMEKNEIA